MIRDPKHLNEYFYEYYDGSFLFRKVDTLFIIVENLDQFKQFVVDNEGEAEDIDSKYAEVLRAEIHFSEMHQFESFFALLLAVFQRLPHWLYLKEYRPGTIRQLAETYLEGDIKTLTNGIVNSEHEFLNRAVYSGFESNKEEHRTNWIANLDDIAWMLRRMAACYIDGLEEYNSYKHGLRILTGHTSLDVSSSDQPEIGIHYASDDSLRILEVQEIPDEGVLEVRQVFKQFSPVESLNHIYFMASVLEVVKATRLAKIKGERNCELIRFFTIDRDSLNKERIKAIRWSVPA